MRSLFFDEEFACPRNTTAAIQDRKGEPSKSLLSLEKQCCIDHTWLQDIAAESDGKLAFENWHPLCNSHTWILELWLKHCLTYKDIREDYYEHGLYRDSSKWRELYLVREPASRPCNDLSHT